ncbi:di-heme oxidoredictase family protein [Amaricoccus macauensis]|uniref:di-heme oxidoreductase family protein n=1 Tax=Amaricoccus macauensis TaxID=57001 RepID=UPI003C7B3EE3
MRQICLSALAGLALIAPAAWPASQDLPSSPLEFIPRTPEEQARIKAVTAPTIDFTAPEAYEALPGGAATSNAMVNGDAFSQSSANMSFEKELDFKVGNGLFKKLWVSAPSSTQASDGLGPLYNARSCQRCHLKDGRGHPPEGPEDNPISMFLRISVPGGPEDVIEEIEDYISAVPDPAYGTQIQDSALPGIAAEAQMKITYEEFEVPLSGGEVAHLRRPSYALGDLGYGPPHPDAMLSPRIAPQMIGLGHLEAIPSEDILALADPDDADGDGISGRANIVWSKEFDRPMLGRFGLKAGTPTIRQQSADAFAGDIGISNPVNPSGWGECSALQDECRKAPDGASEAYEDLEIDSEGLDLVTFYSRNLAVPRRRDFDDPIVLRGKQVFYETGCTACHNPKFVTHRLSDQPEQSFQLIWPYTDMLLHDMGEGLADNRPEARANGREWRTPPLWGIGLTREVSGHTYFLHDGRARSLLEAVLWHGGEAEAARQTVVKMPAADRHALIAFLESL